MLHISLVHSQILYCSQVWRPYLIKNINMLERIHRRATKWILNDYKSSYRSCLVNLHLLPLMYVYEMNDIMFFIKSYKQQSSHISTLLNMSSLVPLIHDLVHLKKWFIIDVPPTLLRTFTFIVYHVSGTHYQKIDLSLSTNIIKHKLYNYTCRIISCGNSMIQMFIPSITSVPAATVQQRRHHQYMQYCYK